MDAKTTAAIERLKKNKDAAEQIMRSGDGKKLMDLLTAGDAGSSLDRATRSAARGDTRELSDMLRALMQNKDAAAVMSRINDSAKKQ